MDIIRLRYKICKPLVVYRLYWIALYHSQTRRHVIKSFVLLELVLSTYKDFRVQIYLIITLSVTQNANKRG